MVFHKEKKKTSPMAAVAARVVIGAGAVAAGTALLKDKKNRDKLQKVAKQVKEHVDHLQKVVKDKKEEGEKKTVESKKNLKQTAEEYIDIAQNGLEEAKKNL